MGSADIEWWRVERMHTLVGGVRSLIVLKGFAKGAPTVMWQRSFKNDV